MTKGICSAYLEAVKDPQAPTEQLRNMLNEIERTKPEIMQVFSTQPGFDLALDELDWTAEYFDRQILAVERNFSRKRIEHQLVLREYLRSQGVKGFVPESKLTVIQAKSEPRITMNYTPSTHIQKFITEGDLHTIRTALRMELNDNRLSQSDLYATTNWIESKVPNLFDEHQEKSFAHGQESDQQFWTSQYYDGQTVYLNTNYSKKRFLHLIEVREYLRQQGVEGFEPIEPRRESKQEEVLGGTAQPRNGHSQPTSSSHENLGRNPIFTAAIMVGGALAALAVLLIALVK